MSLNAICKYRKLRRGNTFPAPMKNLGFSLVITNEYGGRWDFIIHMNDKIIGRRSRYWGSELNSTSQADHKRNYVKAINRNG
jgi:hypothetical protein